MTIDEAIEILIDMSEPDRSINYEENIKALELGIEALKWRKESEEYDSSLAAFPLPGETKD